MNTLEVRSNDMLRAALRASPALATAAAAARCEKKKDWRLVFSDDFDYTGLPDMT